VQYRDIVHTTAYFLFAQANLQLGGRFTLQAGLSDNNLRYWLNEPTDTAKIYPQIINNGPTVSPRFSLLYKITHTVSLFGVIAKGFSPPTLNEIRPTSGVFNTTLLPEYGWNYEAGVKGGALRNRLEWSASFYYFELHDALVSRTDSAGAGYFVNAGGTIQRGIEAWVKAHLLGGGGHFITALDVWNSFSFQPYRFSDYVENGATYSGNSVTGVPRTVNVSGVDVQTKTGWFANITLNCTSQLPLNDANTAYAKAYQLLQAKIGKTFKLHKCTLHVFAGADNLLNQLYSLGDDLNAVHGLYYNPSPKRNYYGGVRVEF
jgi:iron complex outermembrane receptor protein